MDIKLPLETDRLLLRPFAPSDFEALHAILSREDVSTYLYWGPQSEEEVQDRLATMIGFRSIEQPGDTLRLAILLKANGRVIGDVVLHWHDNQHRQGYVGFIVHPDHQGKGYATEATRPLLRVAFEDLGLHRVTGHLDPRNSASAAVLEKLGMRREAHFIENEFVKDEWQSELVYAILDREWAEQKPAKKKSAASSRRPAAKSAARR
jgi:RimJ/RimL family protein N-acetyltransferase